jgi:NAD(P)-dependent dehydrogenase (short-subunit alcohol dehydrogenase family)
MTKLTNKVAMITGAGGGIGRASALRMASEGASVMCTDINTQAAEGTVALILEAGGKADALGLDVSSSEQVADAIDQTASKLGALNILFNNAGVGGDYDWNQTIAINLSGVFHGLDHGAKFMAEHGGGVIINTSSIAGLVGLTSPGSFDPGESRDGTRAYIAAKHGVVGLTKQYAIDYGELGVRVNAIAPGYIQTAMTAEVFADKAAEDYLRGLTPIGRLGQPEEIAAVASFLASDDASFITGVTLPVDGGYSAR